VRWGIVCGGTELLLVVLRLAGSREFYICKRRISKWNFNSFCASVCKSLGRVDTYFFCALGVLCGGTEQLLVVRRHDSGLLAAVLAGLREFYIYKTRISKWNFNSFCASVCKSLGRGLILAFL